MAPCGNVRSRLPSTEVLLVGILGGPSTSITSTRTSQSSIDDGRSRADEIGNFHQSPIFILDPVETKIFQHLVEKESDQCPRP